MTIKKNKKIKFIKPSLDKLAWTGKREWYSALNQEALCIQVNKYSKAYYAQFATIKIIDGKRKTVGHRKFLAPYSDPLELVKSKLYSNIDAWKKAADANVESLNVAALVINFQKYGSAGQRVRTRGKRLNYKNKTTQGYKQILERYILLKTEIDPIELKEKMTSKFNFGGSNYEGALKDVPLDQLTRTDIEIWMARMVDTPAAANHALAALSVAIEYDLKKPKDSLLAKDKGNPCIRIAKYEIQKDKKYIDLEKIEKIKNYLLNEQWRDPHFNTYVYCLLDSGERQSDWNGTYWKKPNNLNEAKRKGCTGYLYTKYDPEFKEDITYLHILDSKNRKPADVELTAEIGQMLFKLRELLSDKESWAYESFFIFPQTEIIERCVNSNSYRVKLKQFNYKFGLGEKTSHKGKNKKGKRKIHKYKNNYTFKHLRKSFATYFSYEHGVEATQQRMRHSSLKVTQDHYINQDPGKIRTRHMYSMRKTRKQHKMVAVAGGKDE